MMRLTIISDLHNSSSDLSLFEKNFFYFSVCSDLLVIISVKFGEVCTTSRLPGGLQTVCLRPRVDWMKRGFGAPSPCAHFLGVHLQKSASLHEGWRLKSFLLTVVSLLYVLFTSSIKVSFSLFASAII